MFEHFRAWLKNPRILIAIRLIFVFIVFIVVLKYFNLYEGFSRQQSVATLEKFENTNPIINHF